METRPLTILVSPLDWGLGHASRMIPLICRFTNDGHRVILAGSGRSAELLKNTFPDLHFISLPSHTIHQGPGKHSYLGLAGQVPAMILAVIREHRIVKKIIGEYNVNIVVSDNRYGLYCRGTYSVFVTHQVSPVLPCVFRWFEYPVYLIIRRMILHFDECWIPDYEDRNDNLSGCLSHRFKKLPNARFIGILSRFNPVNRLPDTAPSTISYDLAVVLSGPEPQISIFENEICRQLNLVKKPVIIIRGLKKGSPDLLQPEPFHIKMVPHLGIHDFSEILLHSGIVLCRSGYSGVMDIIMLGIPAILVPTPGQSEQEYLAGRLARKGWFRVMQQKHMDLAGLLDNKYDQPGKMKKLPLTVTSDYLFIEDLYRKYSQYRKKSKQKA